MKHAILALFNCNGIPRFCVEPNRSAVQGGQLARFGWWCSPFCVQRLGSACVRAVVGTVSAASDQALLLPLLLHSEVSACAASARALPPAHRTIKMAVLTFGDQ